MSDHEAGTGQGSQHATPKPDAADSKLYTEHDPERAAEKDNAHERPGPGDQDGQLSEVGNLEDAGDPIMPDQAVAGAPDAESGSVDEGPAGPNANPNAGARRT
ncbi:hypothetical protein [Nocardioides kribbensis]|uniref:Uncharacterized protein n=1 Tax=Nocardioides kribbensis TaxID=305517 RepID=A0ABV1NYQ4_9ACTN|nr:hypothetical protein [Nocardioides kribbensis]